MLSVPMRNVPVRRRLMTAATQRWLQLWPLLPLLVFLGFIFVYPIGQLLLLSVKDRSGQLTAEHFVKLFSSPVYVQVVWVTLQIAAATTLGSIVLGFPVAYFLATTSKRIANWLILLVLLPFWTSVLVRTFAWLVLLGRNGVLNSWMQTIGLTDEPLQLLYNFGAILVGMIQALMPLAVLNMYAVMRQIDPNLLAAAGTLGGTGAQTFWRVYFPLAMPGVAAGGLLVFLISIGFFITPGLLGGGKETLIAQVIITQVKDLFDWPFAGATSVLLLTTTLAIFYFYNRVFSLASLTGGSDAGAKAGKSGSVRSLQKIFNFFGSATDAIVSLCGKFRRKSGAYTDVSLARITLKLTVAAVLLFLAAPAFFVVPVSFSQASFIQWPMQGFTFSWYEEVWASSKWLGAIWRSIVVGILSSGIAMLIAVPATFVLMRKSVPGKPILLGIFLAPMIMPHIIIAIAVFYLFSWLRMNGTMPAVVASHVLLAIPFVVITTMAILKNYDHRLDQAAASLGAAPLTVFRRITLPLISNGLFAAFLFGVAVSFDELTIVLFVGSDYQPTIPRLMWMESLLMVSPVVLAVSSLLLAAVMICIVGSSYISSFARSRRSSRIAGM